MDMGKRGTVKVNGDSYRYVLSVMDVFRRFVWLRALKDKSSKDVANALKGIYMEHGAPAVIQSDQGTEFKGSAKRLTKEMKIKTIHSRPHHPQSQGKVERSHRSLRAKMEFDLLEMSQKGVNWVKHLPTYQSILNEDPKEVLEYKTPFEVYYTRKPISHRSASMITELVANSGKCYPTNADRRRRDKSASAVRQMACAATERCNKRMIKSQLV